VSLIRPLERRDLPEVAGLYELVMRSGQPTPAPGLGRYFERLLLDAPWADPEIPSLVHLDGDGHVVGFQGSSVRRAVFEGEPIRIACAGQLVAHPAARARAVGAMLVRAYLNGPQDLTITDGATERMRQMWTRLGGDMAHVGCVGWARVLRPWRFGGERLLGEHRLGRRKGLLQRLAAPLDGATMRYARFFAPPAASRITSEPMTPASMVEHLSLLDRSIGLRLDYDERYLAWLFDELAAVRPLGTLVARLVRGAEGRVVGWYVYCLLPGGGAQVLQVAAAAADVGTVLDDLFDHAWRGGAAAVQGRVEPRLLEPLARRRCLMRYTGGALVHSADDRILRAIASERSLLTRLDGEWWMGFATLDFGAAR
jgi:hypothetical protein